MMQELVGRAYMNAQSDLVSYLTSGGNACDESRPATHIATLGDQTPSATALHSESASTALIHALRNNDKKGALLSIERGANVNVGDDEYGASALHWAILNGHKDIAELLISKGANPNAKTKNGATPIYAAASIGQRDIVEMLMARGADVNAKDENGVSPLRIATSKGHKAVVDLLKAKGARF